MGRFEEEKHKQPLHEWLKQNGSQESILNHLGKPDLKNDNRMGPSDFFPMLQKKKKCWLGAPTVSSC